jgi:hypothetical protein
MFEGTATGAKPCIGVYLDDEPAGTEPSAVAGRLAAAADHGQVLVTAALAEQARASGSVVAVAAEPETSEVRLLNPSVTQSVDPACGLLIEHRSAIGLLPTTEGDKWFCSEACVAAFLEVSP